MTKRRSIARALAATLFAAGAGWAVAGAGALRAQEAQLRIPPRAMWRSVKLEETGRAVHPCVYITPEDVQRARRNIEKYAWARQYADNVIASADGVADRDPAWIREQCPKKGAAFAYGFTGCPICSGGWGQWGGANCRFDRPGTVRCASGHVLPDADHPDKGEGYVGKDGRIHYFVGSYNAWVVETYQKWCDWLSLAYTITGREKYARQCAVILDSLAEIYPSCDKGSWDYPSHPPSGRLCRPWYQVARVLVLLVDYYDKIYNSPSLDEPSFVAGLTRRENIERNMLKNGAWYCYEQSLEGGLNNGEADYLRGSLAVGCLLGVEYYFDWAVHGPFGIRAMIRNNADRDGRYFESSLSYAIHARDLYLTFAEPMCNYRSKAYPKGVNLYDDPEFRSFYILPHLSMDCAGHWPRYGDSAPDTARVAPSAAKFHPTDYAFAERISARATDPLVKRAFAGLVHYFAGESLDRLREGSPDRQWLLFHADLPPEADPVLLNRLQRMVFGSVLMGQKGIAILRTPHGEQAQACLMRFGPVLNHGHFDDLNINYFGLGWELTYDLGYGLGSTHTQVGWAKQTASHQLVLVDERRQQPDPTQDDSGGSLHAFCSMPGMQVVDADADNVYRSRGVTTYRRLLALVGDGPDSYLLDVFRVVGGRRHDYLAHSLSADIVFDGVGMSQPAQGSLAGAEFDWGARQLNDGDMLGAPGKPYWSPPPGNGLGFLMHPRRGEPKGAWSATWKLPQGENYLRLTMPADEGVEVISAWAPGIYPSKPKAAHVVARRTSHSGPLASTFIAVRQPYRAAAGGAAARLFLERIERSTVRDGLAAITARHVDGRVDQFVYAGAPNVKAASGEIELDGSFGHLRLDAGRVVGAHLIGNSLSAPGWRLQLKRGRLDGKIARVDYDKNLVYTEAQLPSDGRLDWQTVRFSNRAYCRNTAYTIHRVFQEGGLSVMDLGSQRTILGQGVLDADPASGAEMTSLIPHEYAKGLNRRGTRFFDGKLLASADRTRSTQIVSTTPTAESLKLTVRSTSGFHARDVFYYLDLQPGDDFAIDNWAVLSIDEAGETRVTATDDVELTVGDRRREEPWRAATR